MLNFVDHRAGLGRRAFLRAGALSLGGLSLPALLRAAEAEPRRLLSGRSVIFLFLHGGPSQFETFDPKMSAPEEIRSTTGEIATSIPGVTFGSSFPKLARLAHQLAIVRSFTTGDANHDIKPVVSRHTNGANVGSLYARVAGMTNPASGIPRTALLFPRAVDESTGPEQTNFGRFGSTGTLGAGYAPFVPGAGGDLQQDMQIKLPVDRMTDRRALLTELDRIQRSLDAGQLSTVDKLRQQAFTSLLSGVAQAFDLSREEPRVVERYDTAPLVRPDQIDRHWNNYRHYVDNAKSLGKLLLLARRLCEAGCGFVTVTTNFVWDMHADVAGSCKNRVPEVDKAMGTLIMDLAEKDMLKDTLVLWMGEFGRTPDNPADLRDKAGRDHNTRAMTIWFAGGGTKPGTLVGETDDLGFKAVTDIYRMRDVHATIMHLMGLNDMRLTFYSAGRNQRLTDTGGTVIKQVLA